MKLEKRMSEKIVSLALCAVVLGLCFPTDAQPSEKLARIGLLSATSASNLKVRLQAFREGLRELGYVEGKNIVIEYRYANRRFDRLPGQAAELVRLKMDAIVTGGPAPTRAAVQATSTIPIVMAQENDPVGSGFVESLSRPGGNVTGLSTLSAEISGKRLQLLKESVPNLARVALVGNSTEPGNAQSLEEMQIAGSTFGIQIQYFELQDSKDIEPVFTSIKHQDAGALILFRNPINAGANRKRIIDLVARTQIPGMFPNGNWINAGGLMYYGPNLPHIWRRAASYVDKILKGRKPAALPVEQPMRFDFVVNLKTAKALGITMPPEIMVRATRMIE